MCIFIPLTISLALALIVCAYRTLRAHYSTGGARRIHLTSIGDIYDFLNPSSSLAQQLRARALANRRLQRAFQIDSTFVSGDPAVHLAFKKEAGELIATHRLSWTRFADCAIHAVDLCLPEDCGTRYIALDIFVQRVCLRVVIVALLKADLDDSASLIDDLDFVARGINHLWKISKTTSVPHVNLLAEINRRLHHWLPTYHNPIELILPAYETMWRTVAVMVAVVYDDHSARRALEAFLLHPDTSQFRQFLGAQSSVEAIVQETLRLYPPTRRISRVVTLPTFPLLPSSLTRCLRRELTVAADIESLQRDSVWGPSAHEFDAMRHNEERCTASQRKTLLAFGTGRLTCVAKNWAPQAAALIVAAILDRVGKEKEFEMSSGANIGGRDGWDGWAVGAKA